MPRTRTGPAAPRRALPALAGVLVLLAAAAALVAAAWLRPIDGDEGYYAAAAQLVAGGARPYADFFYPQAPVMPYVYAPVEALAGPDLRALRLLSAAFVLGALAAWGTTLEGGLRHPAPAAAAALAAAAFSPDLVSWGVTVKTYALTGLGATLALVLLHRALVAPGGRGRLLLAAAGLMAGLAGGVRLFFLVLGPALAAGLVLWPGPGGRRRAAADAAWLTGGFALGCLPLVLAWAAGPDLFAFNNLGYHELRFSALRDTGAEPYLLRRAAASVLDTVKVFAFNPYLLAWTALCVLGIASLGRLEDGPRRAGRITALALGVFLAACMTPDPVYDQYFTAPLVLPALPLAAVGMQRLVGRDPRRAASAVGLALLLGGGVMALGRPGMDPDPAWSYSAYREVVADIEAVTDPGDVVLSFWPGYVYGAGRRCLPGLENQFGVGVSEKLDRRELVRYRIADRRRLMDAFGRREARIVVLGTWMNEINTALDDPQMIELLQVFQANYQATRAYGDVKICEPLP
jgi:hypothetical protein